MRLEKGKEKSRGEWKSRQREEIQSGASLHSVDEGTVHGLSQNPQRKGHLAPAWVPLCFLS